MDKSDIKHEIKTALNDALSTMRTRSNVDVNSKNIDIVSERVAKCTIHNFDKKDHADNVGNGLKNHFDAYILGLSVISHDIMIDPNNIKLAIVLRYDLQALIKGRQYGQRNTGKSTPNAYNTPARLGSNKREMVMGIARYVFFIIIILLIVALVYPDVFRMVFSRGSKRGNKVP